MRNRVAAGMLTGILACIIFLYGILSFTEHFTFAAETSLADGTYSIDGMLKSASSEQASMGNAAIVKPMQIVVDEGKIYLRMECKALTTSLGTAQFTGYLAEFYYFPNWEGGSSKVELPKNEVPMPAAVKSYYEDVYDKYNHPKTGTDAKVKGKLYPHYMTIPVEKNDDEIWVQVYVPVMEEISTGSGLQYARLQLDWDTLKQTSTEIPEDMKEEVKTSVDKGGLYFLILSAENLSSRSGMYTSTTQNALKKAVIAAKAVYDNPDATQEQVNEQMQKLSAAIMGLKKLQTETSEKTNSKKLDIKNLEDGIYSVSGQMYKIDKETKSMANEAVGHVIKLTVKKGKYYLTLDFKGLEINSQFGYLSNLKYFVSGYSLDQYGAPQGTTKKVTVDTYQKDSKGNRVSDKFGTNYPDKVTFPLIKDALTDGYVPLRVFVPIMESISAGSGTQPVFLKLDWTTIKSVTDESVFKDTSGTTGSTSSGSFSGSGSSLTAGTGNLKAPSSSNVQRNNAQNMMSSDTQNITTVSNGNETQDNKTSVAAPAVLSVLLSLAGILYKGKSRGLF